MTTKITFPRKLGADPLVISEYVHSQVKRLLRDSIREFVLTTTKALAQYRTSGTVSKNGRSVPLVDTGMTMSVLIPLASHTESGGSIGLGGTLNTYIIQYTNEAIHAFPYKAGNPANKRGKDRTRKRNKGKDTGRGVYEIDYGSPSLTKVSFSFDVDEAAQGVPQINLHPSLRESFTTGAKALEKFFSENITTYINNKAVIEYIRSSKLP